jgi:hypothetical protein
MDIPGSNRETLVIDINFRTRLDFNEELQHEDIDFNSAEKLIASNCSIFQGPAYPIDLITKPDGYGSTTVVARKLTSIYDMATTLRRKAQEASLSYRRST